MARHRAAEPGGGRILLGALVVLFFVAVNQHWLAADRLWRWSIDRYVDWRTDRKVERIERRMDRLDDIVLSPRPAATG